MAEKCSQASGGHTNKENEKMLKKRKNKKKNK